MQWKTHTNKWSIKTNVPWISARVRERDRKEKKQIEEWKTCARNLSLNLCLCVRETETATEYVWDRETKIL